jgi:hypothetical protein
MRNHATREDSLPGELRTYDVIRPVPSSNSCHKMALPRDDVQGRAYTFLSTSEFLDLSIPDGI